MALTKAQLVDMNANELILDLDADTSLHASTDDQIDIKIGGADDFTFTANTFTALAGSSIVVPASGLTIGSTAVTSTAAELNLIDGGASTGTTAVADADGIITNDGGTMRLTTAATFKTYFQQGISTAYDDLTAGDAAVNITTSSGNITIDAAANDSDIIFKGTDNSADITMLTLDGSAAGDATFNNQIIVGDGKLVLNSTAVTSTAAELNLLDGVSGLVQADLTKLAALDATAAEINLIDGGTSRGTTALADADGLLINDDGTMRMTTAATVKTYMQSGLSTAYDDLTIGDAAVLITTSSGNITVDAAANDSDIIFKGTDGGADTTFLTIDGSAAGDATFNNQIIVGDGKLVLGSTAVTSTAAELNLLDNVSGLVQADLTKLAAVDSTATELNIIDGNTTIGTTAVADGDGIVTNDGGTMRQTTVQTFATYFGSEITAMSNLVTTGALDSGSITSGFGAIDNGTSNIRSATITAETAFVPDAANGASLGTTSLEFADLFLHDGAQILFGADQDVVLTHAADAGLTLKTATTSDDTKATLTLQTGDTDIAANDVLGQLHFQAPDEGAGTDAILVAAGIAAISEGDFSASNNATKLSFQTGASEAASEKMSLSSGGILTVADDIIIGDGKTIGSASDPDAMSIAAGGAVTFSQVPVFPDNTIETADIQDNAITLAKMASGTDGNIISFDASGNPVAIATGNDGQVLTSTGAGSPPAFETLAAGGAWEFVERNAVGGSAVGSMNIANLATTGVNYMIMWNGIDSVANSSEDLFVQFSANGSSFRTSGYLSAAFQHYSDGGEDSYSASAGVSISENQASNATNEGNTGWGFLMNIPSSQKTMFMGQNMVVGDNNRVRMNHFGGMSEQSDTAEATTAIRFIFESGNIQASASSFITVYKQIIA